MKEKINILSNFKCPTKFTTDSYLFFVMVMAYD